MYLHPTKGYRGRYTYQRKANKRSKYIPPKRKAIKRSYLWR